MSVLNAFLSTWSNARSTFGDGAPETGARYDKSASLRAMQSNVESAAPGSRWTGGAAGAYGTANTDHGEVLGRLAGLDQRLSAQVDQSSQVVDVGRRNLDSVRQCYPNKAIVVSEFGAEANRDGPVEEKGTYAFQQDFVNFHLGVFATKPWLSGAIYFALQEFRVRPDWDGGNPRPQPPINQKGLVSFDGVRKPAFFDVERIYKATKQFRAAPGASPGV